MFTTARNILYDRSRRKSVRDRYQGELEIRQEPNDLICPERVCQSRQDLHLALASLGSLNPQTREMFMLNRFEGLSYRDIAKRSDLSIGSVAKHMSNANAHLAKLSSI